MEALSQDVSLWRKMLFSLSREDKPVKFLHIIRPSQELSTPILEIVENNFNVDEHSFLVNRRIPLQSCEGLMEFSVANLFLIGRTPFQRFRYMYRQMERAEHIIWHGFYVGHRKAIMSTKELILVSLFPKFLKKTAWVGWGLDIYDWETDESKFSGLRKREVRFFNRLSLQARKSVPYFISLFPPDGKRFSEMFGDHARVFDGTYSNLRFAEILESTRPQQPRSGKLVKILVGHSANVWNYHMDILNDLAQYRYENIRIYIPLSTGVDPEYSKKVQQYANQLFGKKAECITEKMPLKDYIRFLWGMDIAIFRLNRQAALGNLMNLLYMGKKVFLPAGTVMYDFFREQGIDIQDSMGIAQMPFSEFAKLPDHREPPAYILDRTDRQKIVEKWRHIFNEIGGSADNGCEKAAEKTTAAK